MEQSVSANAKRRSFIRSLKVFQTLNILYSLLLLPVLFDLMKNEIESSKIFSLFMVYEVFLILQSFTAIYSTYKKYKKILLQLSGILSSPILIVTYLIEKENESNMYFFWLHFVYHLTYALLIENTIKLAESNKNK